MLASHEQPPLCARSVGDGGRSLQNGLRERVLPRHFLQQPEEMPLGHRLSSATEGRPLGVVPLPRRSRGELQSMREWAAHIIPCRRADHFGEPDRYTCWTPTISTHTGINTTRNTEVGKFEAAEFPCTVGFPSTVEFFGLSIEGDGA